MTSDEWTQCVRVLRAAYPTSFKLNPEGLAVWYEMLSDLPFERVAAAIAHMCRTQEAFPSIAAIRKLAEPVAKEPDEAWSEVMRYANSPFVIGPVFRNGEFVEWQWSDPLIPQVLQGYQGGREIAMADESRLATIRAQFRRDYEAAKKRVNMVGMGDKRLATSLKQNQAGIRVLPGGLEHIVKAMPEGEG